MSDFSFEPLHTHQSEDERETVRDILLEQAIGRSKSAEVSRVGDVQPVLGEYNEVRNATFALLSEAKAHMDRFNGTGALSELNKGGQAYLQAAEVADKFLWKRTEDGSLLKDNQGCLIPTEAGIALQKERQTIAGAIDQLRNVAGVDGRELLQAKLQELKNIDDTLRMSGYVRANHALGLLFACAKLDRADAQIFRQRAEDLIADGQVVDPKTKDDPNFKAYLQVAMSGLKDDAPFQVSDSEPAGDASLNVPRAEKMVALSSSIDQVASITVEQSLAQSEAQQVYEKWMELSQNGSIMVASEPWASLDQLFQTTLQRAESLKANQIDAIVVASETEYERLLKVNLASEKQIAPERVLSSDLDAKKQVLRSEFIAVEQGLAEALKTIPAEKLNQLVLEHGNELKQTIVRIEAEAKFEARATTDLARLRRIEETLQMRVEAAQADSERRFNDARVALSPGLKAAMDAVRAFESREEGRATIQYLQIQGEAQRLRNAPSMIKMFYSHALAVQGDDKNAKQMLQAALSNPAVAAELDRTAVGPTLALKLGLETPAMIAIKAREDELLPERKKVERATELMSDQSRAPADALKEASQLFENAIQLTDRSNRRIENLIAARAKIALAYESALQEIKSGARKEFTAEERRDFEADEILASQANNIALVRYQYALMLNEYGWKHNDETAKAKSIEVLKSIQSVAGVGLVPENLRHAVGQIALFETCPEIIGALRQAEQGKRIDTQVAAAQGLVDVAQAQMSSGLLDGFVVPGSSAALEMIPGIGAPLFQNKEEGKRVSIYLAEAYARNPAATADEIERMGKSANGGWRDIVGDISATGTGLLTRAGAVKATSYILSKCPNPWVKGVSTVVSLVAPVVVAGETKSLVDTGRLTIDPTDKSFVRGAGVYALARGTDRAMQWQAGRNSLSTATLQGISSRFNIPVDKLGTNIGSVRQAMAAEHSLLLGSLGRQAQVSDYAKLGQLAQAVQGSRWSYLSPGSLIPRSAEASMHAFNAGKIDFVQLGARNLWNKSLYTTALPAAAYGSGRKLLYIGTGELQADGNPYALNTREGIANALKDSAVEGGQTALAAAVFIPLAIPFAKMGTGGLEKTGAWIAGRGSAIRATGESLVQRGGGMMAQGGFRGLAGRGLSGLGHGITAGSYPVEVLRVPGYAMQGTGYALGRIPDAGMGALRRVGVSESGIATVTNLSLIGAQPTLLAVDQLNRYNKLKKAYDEVLKANAPTADTSVSHGKSR